MSKGKRFTLETEALEKLAAHAEKKAASSLNQTGQMAIPLEHLQEAPWNARKHYDPQALEDLAKDLSQNGQAQAIVVRPAQNGYEIVAGSRRYRAALIAKLASLQADVRELDDRAARRLSLSENLEREDLNAYEETVGYLEMLGLELEQVSEFAAFRKAKEDTQAATLRLIHRLYNEQKLQPGETGLVRNTPLETAVQKVLNQNKKRQLSFNSFYKHRLPILKYPPEVLETLRRGQLEYTKAQIIAKVEDPHKRQTLLQEAVDKNLSVLVLRKRAEELSGEKPQTLVQRSRELSKRIGEGLTATQAPEIERLLAEIETLLSSPDLNKIKAKSPQQP